MNNNRAFRSLLLNVCLNEKQQKMVMVIQILYSYINLHGLINHKNATIVAELKKDNEIKLITEGSIFHLKLSLIILVLTFSER